ncbi:hypothetical protein ABIB58_001393 [Brevundimonas sp. UYEF29]
MQPGPDGGIQPCEAGGDDSGIQAAGQLRRQDAGALGELGHGLVDDFTQPVAGCVQRQVGRRIDEGRRPPDLLGDGTILQEQTAARRHAVDAVQEADIPCPGRILQHPRDPGVVDLQGGSNGA